MRLVEWMRSWQGRAAWPHGERRGDGGTSSVVFQKYVHKTVHHGVMLSEAKHLLLFEHIGDKQILRFAQNDILNIGYLFQGHYTSYQEPGSGKTP